MAAAMLAAQQRGRPYFVDSDRPFAQRHDTMSMDIVRPHDIPRGKVSYPKNEDLSLKTSDIHTAQPTYRHLQYLEKPDFSVGCTDPDHVGSRARTYYPMMDRRPRDLSLTTADIELAQARAARKRSNRHTDPVAPNYQMPSCDIREATPPRFNGRHTNDISDIEMSCPKRVIPDRNYQRNPNDASDIEYASANYKETMARQTRRERGQDRSLNVKDIMDEKRAPLRNTNPLDPEYQVPTRRTTSLHATFNEERGIPNPDREQEHVGPVHGSKPRKLHWDNGEPQFSLLREDIAGTVPQRWVGAVPANIYDPPEVRPMVSFHDPHDIPGAQVGSLRKGIEGSTSRQCNPLNPRYPMLDGYGGPPPMPRAYEGERGPAHAMHPLLQGRIHASSAPDLHNGRNGPPSTASSRGVMQSPMASMLRQGSESMLSRTPPGFVGRGSRQTSRLPSGQCTPSQASHPGAGYLDGPRTLKLDP